MGLGAGILGLLDRGRRNLVRVLSFGRVEPAAFERALEHLAAGHAVVSAARVLDTLEGGPPLPPRSVLLTFHEERSFVERAWPVLRRHGFPAVLFLPPAAGQEVSPERIGLARQGAALGLGVPHRPRDAAPSGELLEALLALERAQPGMPRLVALPEERPAADWIESLRSARVELAFTRLAGANDLGSADPLRLRSIPIDPDLPLEAFRARLLQGTPRRRSSAGVEPATPEECRAARRLGAARARLRLVHRPLDALLTAGLAPRPRFLPTLRALARRRSSNYERLRNLVRLASIPAPVLERGLRRMLIDARHLPLAADGLELVGYGSAATVFRLGTSAERSHVLKVYRWTLGRPPAESVPFARRHRARYEELRRWFGESVLRTHFLVLGGPLRGCSVAACLQEWMAPSTDLLALSDAEILERARSRPELRRELAAFARAVLEVRERGFFPDLLGAGNLRIVERAGRPFLRLIDFGLLDLRCGTAQLPIAAVDAAVRRWEALLAGLS